MTPAEKWTKRHSKTKAAAKAILRKLGIHKKDGTLTNEYSREAAK